MLPRHGEPRRGSRRGRAVGSRDSDCLREKSVGFLLRSRVPTVDHWYYGSAGKSCRTPGCPRRLVYPHPPRGSLRTRCRDSSTLTMAPASIASAESASTARRRSITCRGRAFFSRKTITLVTPRPVPATISPKSRSNVKTILASRIAFAKISPFGKRCNPSSRKWTTSCPCSRSHTQTFCDTPMSAKNRMFSHFLRRADFFLREPSGVLQGLLHVLGLQIRILGQQFVSRSTVSHLADDYGYGNTHSTNAGAASHNHRVKRYTIKHGIHPSLQSVLFT